MGNAIDKSETLDFYLGELLSNNFLKPVEKYDWDRFVVIHSGNYYLMIPEIENVIEAAFYYLLQRQIIVGKYYLKQNLKEKLKIVPGLKKERIKLIKSQIKAETRILNKCIGEINSCNNENSLKENWRKVISSDLIFLIHFITFELVKCDIKKLSDIVEDFNENYLIDINLLGSEPAKIEIEKFKGKPPGQSIIWAHELYPSKIQPVITALCCFKNIDYLKNLISIYNIEGETNPSECAKITDEIKYSDENFFCKPMPISYAEKHFNILWQEGGMKKPLLSKKMTELFIEKAFRGNASINKLNFNSTSGRKGEIRDIFYQFYFNASDRYEKSPNCTDKYIRLLTDNFNGFNYETVKNNFRIKPS